MLLDYGEPAENYWDNLARFEFERAIIVGEQLRKEREREKEKAKQKPEPLPVKKPKNMKICARCGVEFSSSYTKQIYCSDECRTIYISPIQAIVAKCPVCEKEFTAYNKLQKYCSMDCRYEMKLKAGRERTRKWRESKREAMA